MTEFGTYSVGGFHVANFNHDLPSIGYLLSKLL